MAYEDEGIVEVFPDSEPVHAPEQSNNSAGSSSGVTSASEPSFSALLDQVAQNNIWSAEQAQRQMDFQRQMYERSLQYNSNEAQINRDFQQDSADRAMAFSSAEAAANREWQQMMSSTAHQREMLDLQKAGLNPILAANNGASAGSGATASSAQAAGHAASSSGSPSGAKGDGDQSGTMAIVSLLGKIMDNEVAREQMQNSAEIAASQADMYTAATRYAAELSMIANEYAADRHAGASEYGANMSYQASQNNLDHIFGDVLNGFLDQFGGSRNIANPNNPQGITSFFYGSDNPLQRAHDFIQNIVRSSSYHARAGQINTGANNLEVPIAQSNGIRVYRRNWSNEFSNLRDRISNLFKK